MSEPCPNECHNESWHGLDAHWGPDKVWVCDTCGNIVRTLIDTAEWTDKVTADGVTYCGRPMRYVRQAPS